MVSLNKEKSSIFYTSLSFLFCTKMLLRKINNSCFKKYQLSIFLINLVIV